VNPEPETQRADVAREWPLGHLAVALSELLTREFEQIAADRADHAAGEQACPLGQSAEAAHRISRLCRQLRDQLERFERFDRMCLEAEVDREQTESDDLPF
jgi:hypothetical protein